MTHSQQLFVIVTFLCLVTLQNAMAQELKPCPSSPNCVSSFATTEEHKIAPFSYDGEMMKAKKRLIDAVNTLPRIKLLENNDNYLHFTQTSLIFRFVDDLEFLFDDENKRIDVRSASRVGYSDMGVNRERVEKIRKVFVK